MVDNDEQETVLVATLFVFNRTKHWSVFVPSSSCIRAVLKNFMITFFFPIMLSAMFVRDLRTPYDFIASSMVVNADPKRQT